MPAGVVQVAYERQSDGDFTVISARADWAPEFMIHDLESVDDVLAADPDDYGDDAPHFAWAWIDQPEGRIRARVFASNLGVLEDEATGAAAVRITEYLGRDLMITQGNGSQIRTIWSADGLVKVAGRVVDDGIRQLD